MWLVFCAAWFFLALAAIALLRAFRLSIGDQLLIAFVGVVAIGFSAHSLFAYARSIGI
jgi:hypothetical protein